MQNKIIGLILGTLILMTGCAKPELEPALEVSPYEREGFTLLWQDEFDGENLNPKNWTHDLGGGGWGNHELQTYTDNRENVRVENGKLVIEVIKHDAGPRKYTSARLKTQGLQTFTYGRIESRMKLPKGNGIWSAFWMLGEDFPNNGWPHCGEIDILENIGKDNHIYGTLHGPTYFGGRGVGDSYVNPEFDPTEYHIYAIEWQPNEIKWYVDDANYITVHPAEVPGKWVFDHPFFIILNLAVGGDWPGSPTDETEFPQQMLVDYVRVYRSLNEEGVVIQTGGTMHIDEVTLDIIESENDRWGEVFVHVKNQDGNPVEGARVTGGWLGSVRKGDSDKVSDARGIAGPFLSDKTTIPGDISFCVTSIVGGGYTYDKPKNNQTCAFSTP